MRALKSKVDAISLQDRDHALLSGLFESRVMTTAHVTTLYFDNKPETAKKRLYKLKKAGLIKERSRRAFERSVLFLTFKGLALAQEHGILSQYPPSSLPALERRARVSDLTIRHELEVMDVKTAFHTAIRKLSAFSISEFSTWPLLNQFNVYRQYSGVEVPVKPDGFVGITEIAANGKKYEHAFFLELDRSNEIQDRLAAKAVSYLEYYKSGGFAVRNNGHRDDYKEFPFRVLMVFRTTERRNNTAERLLQNSPPILTMVWLATFDDVIADPLGAIWIRPADYRDALESTRFNTEYRRRAFEYRRQPEREALVEAKVCKMRLLDERPSPLQGNAGSENHRAKMPASKNAAKSSS
jgi:hypothetical protein